MKFALLLLMLCSISLLKALPALSSTPVEEVKSAPHYQELQNHLNYLNEQFRLTPTIFELNLLLKNINEILNEPFFQEKLAYATNPSAAFDLMEAISQCLRTVNSSETLLPDIYRYSNEMMSLKRTLDYLNHKYPKSINYHTWIYLLPIMRSVEETQ